VVTHIRLLSAKVHSSENDNWDFGEKIPSAKTDHSSSVGTGSENNRERVKPAPLRQLGISPS
jgi:hypothetical protein